MRKWLGRLGNVIRPARMDRDLERELRFHVAERIDELQESGMSEDAAARLAQQQFGNYTTQMEGTRDMNISDGLDALLRHVRLAARGLAKSPAFSTYTVSSALPRGATWRTAPNGFSPSAMKTS